MIFLYDDLHIIWKPRNVKISKHSSFFHYWTKICLMVHWKFGFLHCSSDLINSENLVIFKFRNSKSYLNIPPPTRDVPLYIIQAPLCGLSIFCHWFKREREKIGGLRFLVWTGNTRRKICKKLYNPTEKLSNLCFPKINILIF